MRTRKLYIEISQGDSGPDPSCCEPTVLTAHRAIMSPVYVGKVTVVPAELEESLTDFSPNKAAKKFGLTQYGISVLLNMED